ncbi:hypothetical protein BCR41DRAFT_109887 [Lobosporangium transversale]|uniref:Uncharacterized protein n=1 Tax=Lobosporangium transversale TaxID=64571 RepID=A0A1Y2GJX4_9FUNG|nr:hypothetical protein BCR41DRAFT_113413 [Lobosporangium transversale]XP_021879885.1 hypothetical protein BCR41DRAFT_109887 [Lobosporangium transversale]ORZ10905.1 hypothetical protein BCR41DRAFT_113413 [Lobosporangium transversale]ORZ11788.1 hypothetical protein BCR41DRAFT_109887 [Lobosporangium transversale]|eukprot:XP_021879422.1 hypothetical protein BCR41DRAFT_113413 [Lobosporangium transversale]
MPQDPSLSMLDDLFKPSLDSLSMPPTRPIERSISSSRDKQSSQQQQSISASQQPPLPSQLSSLPQQQQQQQQLQQKQQMQVQQTMKQATRQAQQYHDSSTDFFKSLESTLPSSPSHRSSSRSPASLSSSSSASSTLAQLPAFPTVSTDYSVFARTGSFARITPPRSTSQGGAKSAVPSSDPSPESVASPATSMITPLGLHGTVGGGISPHRHHPHHRRLLQWRRQRLLLCKELCLRICSHRCHIHRQDRLLIEFLCLLHPQ